MVKNITKDSTSREIMIQTGNRSGFWVAHIARRIKCYPTCIQENVISSSQNMPHRGLTNYTR